MSECPKMSVIVATRNRVLYLKRMLDKLLEDDYPRLEIVIVDGASTDGTVELVKSYGPSITKWVSEPDAGEYFAYNKGLGMATGEIIKLMSDDDVLRPGAFRLAGDYFNRHPEVDIVFGQTAYWEEVHGSPIFIGETNELDPQRLTVRHWLRQTRDVSNRFGTPNSVTAFLRRRVFDRLGPLATQYVCGDLEFWARAASKGLKVGLLPQVVLDYHLTGDNGVIKKSWKAASDMVALNRQYGDMTDLLHCIWRKYVRDLVPMICNGLRIHPLGRLRRLRRRYAMRTP